MAVNRRELLVGSVAALASTISATAARSGTREARQLPRRGVNVSHWFAASFEGYDRSHYAHFVGAARISQLARLGFDHVRLPIDPALLFSDEPSVSLRPERIFFLKEVIELLHSQGLAVVLDMHPIESTKGALVTPDGAATFLKRWRLLAAAFAQTQPPIYLEVLNEPSPVGGETWWSLQERLVHAIRKENESVTIIANGGNWSGIDDLIARRPYSDPKILYTVHYYDPILFTQQSGEWGWPVAERVAKLNWPLSATQAAPAAHRATHDDEASGFVRDAVASGSFTFEAMASSFERLSQWQKANGNPRIYIGEFGVLARQAPPLARTTWLQAAREGFEARGWGWALWDLSPTFGLLRPRQEQKDGAWDGMPMDGQTLKALGMAA